MAKLQNLRICNNINFDMLWDLESSSRGSRFQGINGYILSQGQELWTFLDAHPFLELSIIRLIMTNTVQSYTFLEKYLGNNSRKFKKYQTKQCSLFKDYQVHNRSIAKLFTTTPKRPCLASLCLKYLFHSKFHRGEKDVAKKVFYVNLLFLKPPLQDAVF